MALNQEQVEKLAHLAQLELNESQRAQYQQELEKLLQFFSEISKVDTHNIEPLVTPTEIQLFLREDQVITENSQEEILSNAAERSGNLFQVPPVVGG